MRHAIVAGALGTAVVLGACGRAPAADPPPAPDTAPAAQAAADPASDAILAAAAKAQEGRTRLQGVFTMRSRRLGDELGQVKEYTGRFLLEKPDRYSIRIQAKGHDAVERFISDGRTTWHVDQPDPELEPDVTAKAVERGGDGDPMARVGDFLSLRLDALRRDFTITAAPVADPAGRLCPKAAYLVTLAGRTQALRENAREVLVELDATHQPVALRIRDGRDNLRELLLADLDHQKPIPAGSFSWPPVATPAPTPKGNPP